MTVTVRKNILLVEDNVDHADILRFILNRLNIKYSLFHVTDGATALDYLCKRGRYKDAGKYPDPDVMFLDLRLPKIDGLEVLKELNDSADVNIPVVVITTSSADNDITQAQIYNVKEYLIKPVDNKQINNILTDIGFEHNSGSYQ